ncbi:MAG: hypothetical protein AB8E15_12140, partial [Bdellovibrionales bacterium]
MRLKLIYSLILTMMISGLFYFRVSLDSTREVASISQINDFLVAKGYGPKKSRNLSTINAGSKNTIKPIAIIQELKTRPTTLSGLGKSLQLKWKNGKLDKTLSDLNKDGKVDSVSNFKNGRIHSSKVDRNFDGKIDKTFKKLNAKNINTYDDDYDGIFERSIQREYLPEKKVIETHSNLISGKSFSISYIANKNGDHHTEGKICTGCDDKIGKAIKNFKNYEYLDIKLENVEGLGLKYFKFEDNIWISDTCDPDYVKNGEIGNEIFSLALDLATTVDEFYGCMK